MQRYNHFSLLKTIEGALGLPCLNHACDSSVNVMFDLLFGTFFPQVQTQSVSRDLESARIPVDGQ